MMFTMPQCLNILRLAPSKDIQRLPLVRSLQEAPTPPDPHIILTLITQ